MKFMAKIQNRTKSMKRKGCIYSEIRRDFKGREQKGRGSAGYLVRGVGFVPSERRRWVGELCVHCKVMRFRSVHLSAVQAWLREMIAKYGDEDFYEVSRQHSIDRNQALEPKKRNRKKRVSV